LTCNDNFNNLTKPTKLYEKMLLLLPMFTLGEGKEVLWVDKTKIPVSYKLKYCFVIVRYIMFYVIRKNAAACNFFSYKYTTTSREEGGASLCITVCIRNRICIRIYKNGRIKSLWRLPEEVIEGKSEILIWEWYTQMTNGNASSINQVNVGHQVIKVDIYYTLTNDRRLLLNLEAKTMPIVSCLTLVLI